FFSPIGYHRQIYPEGRPFARFAVYIDIPAMLFDYTIDHRQAEPCSLANFLCREEWLKYILPGLVVYANTRVGYRQDGIQPCAFKRVRFSVTAVNVEYSRLYGQL